MRVTGVCRKQGGQWKIVQWHASLAVPDAETPAFKGIETP
jgi:hypothetical protein